MPDRSYEFVQLDVFTKTPLAANPLAIFTDARGLDGLWGMYQWLDRADHRMGVRKYTAGNPHGSSDAAGQQSRRGRMDLSSYRWTGARAAVRFHATLLHIFRRVVSVPLLIFCIVGLVDARVIRVEVTSRDAVLGGMPFGNAGSYERIVGRIYFAAPVGSPHNQRIVDLDKAVNLSNGEVEFSAEFVMVCPKDLKRGNGSMLLEVPNRGRARIISLVDGGTVDLKDAGDAWLLRNGYAVASLGWQ